MSAQGKHEPTPLPNMQRRRRRTRTTHSTAITLTNIYHQRLSHSHRSAIQDNWNFANATQRRRRKLFLLARHLRSLKPWRCICPWLLIPATLASSTDPGITVWNRAPRLCFVE